LVATIRETYFVDRFRSRPVALPLSTVMLRTVSEPASIRLNLLQVRTTLLSETSTDKGINPA
jgi:hypothetical protein